MARHLEQAWTEAIRPTLTDYIGDAFFLSTPKGSNYFRTLYGMVGQDDDWMSWQMPTTANPWIDAEEVGKAGESLPSIAFRQEYLAEFVDAAGARIKREWLRYGDCSEGLPTYIGVDLAISTKSEADYTGVAVVSRGDDGTIYVRDINRTRADFASVLRFIEAMAEKWNPSMIGIEQVQYQAAVVQELLRRTKLPIRGIRPDRDKVTRFAPLEARYEQSQVMHCQGLPAYFEDELLSFPVGRHDDVVDALAYAWQVCGQRKSWGAV
jgi:predicted phage terminase large subunit-like protein